MGGEEEVWVLRSVAGSELPALVTDFSNLLVLSDTLVFGLSHSSGPVVLSRRRVGVEGGPPSQSSVLYHLERDDSRITLRMVCPAEADCVFLELQGEVEGATMTLSYTPSGSVPTFRSPSVYERVR